MKEWEVWSEGYIATGESGDATFHGRFMAETFLEACDKFAETFTDEHSKACYGKREIYVDCPISEEHPLGRKLEVTAFLWACRLFDNEKDARKFFG